MLNKRIFVVLILVFLTLFSSCRRKQELSKNTPLQKIQEDEVFEMVNPEDPARLPIVKASNLYIGTFDKKEVVVKILHSTVEKLEGVFYQIDTADIYLNPVSFSVETDEDCYCWRCEGKSLDFDMKYQCSAGHFNGVVEQEYKGFEHKKKLYYFDFREYTYSDTVSVNSKRYQQELFEVDCEQNVVYGRAKGPWTSLPIPEGQSYAQALLPYLFKASSQKDLDLTMDIYTPRNDSMPNRPLVVLIHGGSFFFGDKHDKEMIAQCSHLASMGYVAVSLNYRMGFELSKASIQRCAFKAIQDAHAAMRFLSHHAEQYGIDRERMYLGGSSAGSITAMSMVYMTDESRPKSTTKKHFAGKFGSLFSSGNDYTDHVKVKGLINMWGALYELADVEKYPIPIVSFHGTADKIVPCYKGYPFTQLNGKDGKAGLSGMYFDEMYGSDEIHKVLKNKHVHQEFYPLEGLDHAPWKGEDRKLNEVYYFIQQRMSAFLFDDLIYDVRLKKEGHTLYRLTSPEVKQAHWQLKGGIVLSRSNDAIDIRLFRDAPEHYLSVSGLLNNDAEFRIGKLVN